MPKKILLKLSGEFLQNGDKAIAMAQVEKLAEQINEFVKKDFQVAIVIGAGNIMRGRNIDKVKYPDLVPAHYAGMLGAVINGLMLNMVLQKNGINSRIESPFDIRPAVNVYEATEARKQFDTGAVIILGGGTGKPGVSTDTAAMDLAADLGVEVIYKGTLVDGVYSYDPKKNPAAVKFKQLTYDECLNQDLKIMDKTAFQLGQQHRLPVVVFEWNDENIAKIIADESVGTVIG